MPTLLLLRDVRNKHTHKPLFKSSIDWNKYYQQPIWKELRQWKRIEQPICERCLEQGIITPVEEVHHRCPISNGRTKEEREMLLSDKDNLVSLCSNCHKYVHAHNDKEYIWTLDKYYNRKYKNKTC